uniref:Miff domain-containing protein n=1 Tax=Mesocestoides corti TaxID=53468 RepID=A0A5K3EP49_MESCO
MDPLQVPLISKYEWEYKNDINQSVAVPEHPESTPGYSPDLLTNDDFRRRRRSSVTATTVEASASASAKVHVQGSRSSSNLDGRMRTIETRLSHLEAHVSRLSSRLRALEQHHAVLGGLITIYVGLKVNGYLPLCAQIVKVWLLKAYSKHLTLMYLVVFYLLTKSYSSLRDNCLVPPIDNPINAIGLTSTGCHWPDLAWDSTSTSPTSEDVMKSDKFRKKVKILSIILTILTVFILAIGIYLVADVGRSNAGLEILGCVMIVLGLGLLASLVFSASLFLRLVSSFSETKIYRPKSADALQLKPYPRQTDVRLRQRRVWRTDTEAALPGPLDRGRAEERSTVISDSAERIIEPRPAPSAPQLEEMAVVPPNVMPPLPPDAARPPSYAPPPYDDLQ